MHQKFKRYLERNPKLKTAKLLLAISGGIDSMVLWDLLEHAGLNVHLAHVNFQLRGVESDQDQEFLKKLAEQRNVTLYVLSRDTNKIAKNKGQSTQIAAREIRYTWFKELMREHNFDYLLTAHHLDDSIETFFINLNRGTGIKGLLGIQDHGKTLRPLLDYTKNEILVHADKNKIQYREDASNRDSHYLRNWFRNELLPLWETKNKNIKRKMQENMQRLKESSELIEHLITLDLKEIIVVNDEVEISFRQIEKMKAPKQSLMALLEPLGFNYIQVGHLLNRIHQNAIGSRFLANHHEAIIDRESIFIIKKKLSEGTKSTLIHANHTFSAGKYNYNCILSEGVNVDFKQENIYYMDADKIKFPVEIRKWEKGDRIKPLGMNGNKLVSDILIDNKVPLHEKEQVFVLVSDKQLIAVVDYRISENVKITENTRNIWSIQWRKR